MSYTPYLISKYATGLDRELQPWVEPDDAWIDLLDSYVYRGITNKRDGYSGFANGLKSIYCESRMVHRIPNEATGQINNGAPLANITLANKPVRRGTVTVSDGVTSIVDNGIGGFPTATAGAINYTTGVISGFQFPAASANPVTVTYDYHQGFQVMGEMVFYNSTNTRQLIVADTDYVNRYNPVTDRLDDISPATPYGAGPTNFWSWVNYNDAEDNPRLLFVNNNNKIQKYNGSTVSDYIAGVTSKPITGEVGAVGNGTAGPYTFNTVNIPVAPNSVTITAGAQVVTDDGAGGLEDMGSGTINYTTGAVSVTFTAVVALATNITINYSYYTEQIETALQIFQNRDRLIAIRTTEGGNIKPKRIRISGFGENTDVFTEDAPGAGHIDIPDDSWIYGAAFNRDDLMIFTELGTWTMKYTGNDVVPFTLERVDSSRGCKAAFTAITYLNRTMAASPRGLIISDGYRIERMDNKVPEYAMDEIDPDRFDECFSGFIDEERDVYLIHQKPNVEERRILVSNFEEDNFSVYRIPLSTMGNFVNAFDITWDDLTAERGFPTWEALEDVYEDWNSFAFTKGTPIAIGGGMRGQIWKLNVTELEDDPLKIRAISRIDQFTIRVTTDFNTYLAGDVIYLNNVPLQINNQQGSIVNIVDNYTFDLVMRSYTLTPYTGNDGTACRVIPFICTTKTFNPFAEADKKVLTGWLYMYVTVSGTHLQEIIYDQEQNIIGTEDVPCQLDLEIFTDDFGVNPEVVSPVNVTRKIDLTNLPGELGEKKWVKIWINQTAKFIQFRFRNQQAGARIQIHAMMPGFRAVGRLV